MTLQDPCDLPVPADDIRTTLATIIIAALDHDMQHSEDCHKEMDQWQQACHEIVMKRLEGQLRKHRPRHGILEEDVCSKRRAILRNQHLIVEAFLDNQAERIAKGVGFQPRHTCTDVYCCEIVCSASSCVTGLNYRRCMTGTCFRHHGF